MSQPMTLSSPVLLLPHSSKKEMSLHTTHESGESSNEKNLSLLGKKPQSASI